MVLRVISSCVLAAALAAGLAACSGGGGCGGCGGGGAVSRPAPPPPAAQSVTYVCPMDGATRTTPGPCPRCGMTLDERHRVNR